MIDLFLELPTIGKLIVAGIILVYFFFTMFIFIKITLLKKRGLMLDKEIEELERLCRENGID